MERESKKLVLLRVLHILEYYSDCDHPLTQDDILKFLTICPRGYFMDGELCIYQGYDMTPGAKWALTDDGKKIVQQYVADLRAIFNLNDETRVYTGVIVGEIGEVWKKINMVLF